MKPYNDTDGKKEQVRAMFDGIARRYDLLNHLLSLGVDRGWRRRVVRAVRAERPRSVLDMATGTADLAIMLAKSCPGARVVGRRSVGTDAGRRTGESGTGVFVGAYRARAGATPSRPLTAAKRSMRRRWLSACVISRIFPAV